MKTTGTGSGCVVWLILFGVLGACLFPIAMVVGGVSSVSNVAMQTLRSIICSG